MQLTAKEASELATARRAEIEKEERQKNKAVETEAWNKIYPQILKAIDKGEHFVEDAGPYVENCLLLLKEYGYKHERSICTVCRFKIEYKDKNPVGNGCTDCSYELTFY